MDLHWDVLDEKRTELLPQFALLKPEGFYLAGGTALALYLGHRDSIDFDFFKSESFDTGGLFENARKAFEGHRVVKTQEEKDTLSVVIDKDVRVSFFSFPYPLINRSINTEYFPIASIEDIACMKLSAITGRGAFKDYVDLFFILKMSSLEELIGSLKKKIPALDPLLVLKSFVFFDDLQEEKIVFKMDPVSLIAIKRELTNSVREYEAKRS